MKIFLSMRTLAICILVLWSQIAFAQDLFKAKDLSNLRVSELVDADILKFKTQLNSAGITLDQAQQIAIAKGMPQSEFLKLKNRIETIKSETSLQKSKIGTPPERINPDTIYQDQDNTSSKTLIDPLIFGSELYTSISPNFEPNVKLATPFNYIVGPDDQLLISVYGMQEYNGELEISSEGFITIPTVGQVRVVGLTIEAVTQKIKSVMGQKAYSSLRSGESKLSVTVNKIRSIKVLILGANRSGTFTVSSLSTVFNALYLAGGPNSFGSFREIELIRNNKIIQKIDLYRFLVSGDQSDNIGLKDNDVIRIPTYKKRIELKGQVKRPGYFEVLEGESFSKILEFASGFTDTAYRSSVKVFQISEKERKIFDLDLSSYSTYLPQTGDLILVSKILNRFANRVRISGSVFRPDTYQFTPELTVADLIRKADGVKEDAYLPRGQIIRLEDDLTKSIKSFDVRKALANDPKNNIILKREDEVFIVSISDLRDSFNVTINGEVRIPGKYEYFENLTVKDLILQAGGFTDAAFRIIEIARLIKRDSINILDSRASTLINLEIDGELSLSSGNIKLEPFDVVTIRRKAGYILPELIIISGQIQYPGSYALTNRTERVSDILRRSGGYTPDAYPEGSYLKRYKSSEEMKKLIEDEKLVKKLQRNVKDTSELTIDDAIRDHDIIPLDMKFITKAPGSIADIIVRANDEIIIPKFNEQIEVSGSVLFKTQVPYQRSKTLEDYVNDAGGYSGNAWRKKAYVVYANGKAASTKHFLFFNSSPKILPGSKIVVPRKPERRAMSIGEIIGVSSGLASLAGVVIALLRL